MVRRNWCVGSKKTYCKGARQLIIARTVTQELEVKWKFNPFQFPKIPDGELGEAPRNRLGPETPDPKL